MATISENLQTIKDSTEAIKQAIIDKGGTISGDITTWAEAISGISGGGGAEEEITFTGTISKTSTSTSVTFQIDGSLSKRPSNMSSYSNLYLAVGLVSDEGAVFNTCSIVVTINNFSFTHSLSIPPVLPGTQVPDYKPALFVIGKDIDNEYITRIVPVKIIELTPIKFYLNDTEYNALSSMTWEQFVNSETYNPTLTDVNGTSYKAFFIEGGVVYYNLLYDGELDMQVCVYIMGNMAELSTNIIKENTQYIAD